MKQITIKEISEMEGEVFNYVLYVDEETEQRIIDYIDQVNDEFDQAFDSFTVLYTDYKPGDLKMINQLANNSYMDFIAFYEIRKWVDEMFYRGNGLNKLPWS